MPLLDKIDSNWKSAGIIIGIIGVSIFGWDYMMTKVAQAAETTVKATVNKEMVDGAKAAAKAAVQEAMAEQKAQMQALIKEAAREVAREVVKQQKAEVKAEKARTP
jgi:hypothetical protein